MRLSRAYYFAGQYENAASALRTCVARAEGASQFHVSGGGLCRARQNGRNRPGRKKMLPTLSPNFSIGKSVRGHPPSVPAALQFHIESLHKAGIPEWPVSTPP